MDMGCMCECGARCIALNSDVVLQDCVPRFVAEYNTELILVMRQFIDNSIATRAFGRTWPSLSFSLPDEALRLLNLDWIPPSNSKPGTVRPMVLFCGIVLFTFWCILARDPPRTAPGSKETTTRSASPANILSLWLYEVILTHPALSYEPRLLSPASWFVPNAVFGSKPPLPIIRGSASAKLLVAHYIYAPALPLATLRTYSYGVISKADGARPQRVIAAVEGRRYICQLW